ncbi:hypothetical protein RUM43_009180 [Polyplax serrata]|uniref:Uncharacterized protein n=1 Tax=Polyplax serrata TaxID=468196 RepID=A0AAN8S1X1_POLSC
MMVECAETVSKGTTRLPGDTSFVKSPVRNFEVEELALSMSSSPVVFFFGVPGPMPRTYNSRHPLLKDRLLSVLFDVEARSTQPVQDSVGGYRQPEFEIDGLDEDSSSGLDEISSRLFAEARPVLGYGQSDVDDESQPGAPVFVAFQPILQLLFPKRCSDPTSSHGAHVIPKRC